MRAILAIAAAAGLTIGTVTVASPRIRRRRCTGPTYAGEGIGPWPSRRFGLRARSTDAGEG